MTERKQITLTAAADCPNCNGTGWHVDVVQDRIVFRTGSEWLGLRGERVAAEDLSRLCSCLRPDGVGR